MLRTIIYVHVYIILDSYNILGILQRFVNQNAHVYIKQFSLLKVIKIPTQKGEHSCKCSELSL